MREPYHAPIEWVNEVKRAREGLAIAGGKKIGPRRHPESRAN